MKDGNLKATALVAKNSISYVTNVFALNEARQPLVNVLDEGQITNFGGITVDKCIVPEEKFGWFSEHHTLIHDETPAQVAYTSGTEGLPKGIVLSYANIADAAERIINVMKITADIREYVGIPVTYSFGMGRFRVISAVGGKAYLPPRGFDPLELVRMLSSGEVNALSAVPTLLRILIATPDIIGESGKKLRWLEIGSQFMTADEKQGIREMFPNAKIVQHYGLTEASRSTFLDVSDVSDELLESVGRPVGGTEVDITTEGRIKIRGPHVAQHRIDADGFHELCDSEGWLVTNDLGHIEEGNVYFDGRADDLINCGGIKIYPDTLEARIRSLLGQDITMAVAKFPDAMRGEGVLVVIESNSDKTDHVREAAITALREIGVDVGKSLRVRSIESMPQTATGKPQRKILTEKFSKEEKNNSTAVDNPVSIEEAKNVRNFFNYMFPGESIGAKDTFETLGGDSLNHIRFSLNFERRFGSLPDSWEMCNVMELQEHVDTSGESIWRRLEAVTLTRAIGMICIVALHFETFIYSLNWGAAYFLFMVSGYSVTRFQLPEINRTGSVKVLFNTIQRIAIPTILVIAGLQLLTLQFQLKPLLLISNFFDPSEYAFYYYFVELYIQLLLLAALLFSFSKIREQFQNRPMLSAISLLILVSGTAYTINLFWDTNYLYSRVPHNYAWCFVLGIVMASANSMNTRLLAMVVVVVACWLKWGPTSAMYWVTGGCAMLLLVREVWVVAPLRTIVAEIASASMFIYLSHYMVISLVTKIFGERMPWVGFEIALIVGIIFAHVYDWGDTKVRKMIKLRKFTFGDVKI
jgi:acyl-CoA synthetase (AMP-forming)/AMP-acid ligase II